MGNDRLESNEAGKMFVFRKVVFSRSHEAKTVLLILRASEKLMVFKAAVKNITASHSKLTISLSVLLFALTLSGCAAIYRSGFVSVPRQPISGPITIGAEWVEVVPPAPLRPYGNSQFVNLEVEGFKKTGWKYYDDENTILELADDRTTNVEAFLFDNKGQSYQLEVSQTSGGPQLYRKGKIKWSGKPNFSEPDYSEVDFPSDRLFTKLRIRSEISLNCKKIEWVGYNPK